MKAIPLSLMLAGAVAVGACDRATEPPTTATPGTFDRMGAQTGDNDDWITTQVEARLYSSENVTDRVRVSTNEGVVTLSGRVQSEQVEGEAVRLARGVDGVRDVRSQLTVQDASPAADRSAARTDTPGERRDADRRDADRDETGAVESAWITTRIQSQYFTNRDIKARNIDVTTRDGIVTVSGSVENEAQRQEALRIARATDGVRDVRDRLRIGVDPGDDRTVAERRQAEPDARLSDDDLEARVQSRFYQDNDLRAHRIDVDVSDGVVTLSGDVPSETRRRQAVATARNVDGVRDVRDELDVRADDARTPRTGAPAARGTDARDRRDVDERPMGERFEDGWITTKIQAQFYLDTDLRGRSIDVTTQDGVVTLSGEVESERHRQMAIETARDTDGVRNVVDQLRIVTSLQNR
jgi:hyperosmotically inducible periplasmic protein